MQIPASYTDYFEALVWAMVTLERWTHAEDVRVVPVGSGITIQPIRATDAADLEHPPAP
jgi:phosphatidylserine decarboxylase